jgi:hypothetical protein
MNQRAAVRLGSRARGGYNQVLQKGQMMMSKKRKKAPVRPVVSLRVRPAMYEDLVREADKRRIKLSEEVERRLMYYDTVMQDWGELVSWDQKYRDILTDDTIDKLAERIAKKIKSK